MKNMNLPKEQFDQILKYVLIVILGFPLNVALPFAALVYFPFYLYTGYLQWYYMFD